MGYKRIFVHWDDDDIGISVVKSVDEEVCAMAVGNGPDDSYAVEMDAKTVVKFANILLDEFE